MLRHICIAIFTLIAISLHAQHYNKVLVISDIDDTYKVTNTTKQCAAFYNAMFSRKIFAAMDYLYSCMNNDSLPIFYVSNSPKIIQNRINKLIRKHHQGDSKLYLRKLCDDGFQHKMNTVQSIINSYPDYSVILIGDNSENDAVIYDSICVLFPDRIAAVYIRPVKNKPFGQSSKIYFSAVDIAFFECESGRITPEQFEHVYNMVLEADFNTVFPKYLFFDERLISSQEAGCFKQACHLKNKVLEYLLDKRSRN